MLVLFLINRLLTEFIICAEKESRINNDRGFENLEARLVQIFLIQYIISCSFIQPVLFAHTTTFGGKFPCGIFLSLKIISGGSFVPSAIQLKITVKLVFSYLVVQMLINRAPVSSIV